MFTEEVNKAWNLLKRPIVLRNNLLVDQPVRKKARGSAKELDLLAVNEPLQLPFNDEDINYFDFGNNGALFYIILRICVVFIACSI